MSLKLIGAGFGRTGTMSLKIALEQLGFGKCYHMTEVIENPHHAGFWMDVMDGRSVDWHTFFADYQATVDWPGCTFYQELMAQYPEAKVLLSIRDPERWYESAANTIHAVSQSFPRWIEYIVPQAFQMIGMGNRLIWRGTFNGRFEDKAYAISVFNAHNEAVKQFVPPERLLVYDVKQGWEPLCAFLGAPVPSTPFPHANDTAAFQQMVRNSQRGVALKGVAVATAVATVAMALWWLLRGKRASRP